MPRINKVAHVVLGVTDVARSKVFYRDVLGMEIISDRPNQGPSAFLSFGSQHHDIALFQAPLGSKRGELGLVHVALQLDGGVEELKGKIEELEALGIGYESPVTHGITNSIYLLDPDGNKIEIYAEVFPTAQEGIDYMRAQEGYGVTAPITL